MMIVLRSLTRTVPVGLLACAAMGYSGSGMAAGSASLPGLFSIDHNLQIVGGDVSADCPLGSVCQELPGTGNGLLIRSVKTSAGVDYIQSIIAENLAGGGLFANEQDVRQGVQGAQNAANISQKMVIDDPANGFSANHTMVDSLPGHNLNGLPLFQLNQTVDLDNGAFAKVRIRGAIHNANIGADEILNNFYFVPGSAREQLGGLAVYIDQLGGPNERELGDFVYRNDRTTLSVENQLLDNTLGSVNTGPAYNTNASLSSRVGAVFISQSVTGMDNDFGLLKYGAGLYTYSIPTQTGTWAPTWTPTLVSLDVLSANPSSNQVSLDPTDGYGTWGAGSVAQHIFGALGDTTDFSIQGFMP